MSDRRAVFLLACLTLLAAVLRLWWLHEVPPGLFLDEAGNGLDALDILAGRPAFFFARSLGKEPLLNYLIVPFVAGLGREPLAVRLPAALVGMLTVPATFFLARELWHEEGRERATWIGLIAAGLLAVSYWAVTLNRISFRANTLPLLAAVAFTLVWRTWRRGGTRGAVAAGVTLGLCFYTYLAGRFVYPLALVGLGLAMRVPAGRQQLRRRRRELLLVVGVCLAVMLPLLVHFARHPEDFTRRAGLVVFTHEREDGEKPLARLRDSLLGNLGMFGGTGDMEPRHNLPGRSLLTPWLAVLFWSGMGLALWRGRRHPPQGFAVAWFGILLLPAILAAIPPRHALRAIGTQPVVYSLCAWACVAVVERLSRRHRPNRLPPVVMGLVLAGLVTVEAALTVSTYFGRWANDPATYVAYLGQDRAVAGMINRAPPDERYIVPLNDRWRALGGKYTFDFLVSDRSRVLFFFPRADDAIARLTTLASAPGVRRVRVVWITEGDDVSADPQRVTALLLGQMAQPLAAEKGAGYTVEDFIPALSGPVRLSLPAPTQPIRVSFADAAGQSLLLTGWNAAESAAATDAHVTAGGLGTVALEWSATAPPSALLRVSLRLVDAYRQPVGQADSDLVDTMPLYNPDWSPGHTAITYHPLEAAPGTPPGTYTLLLALYEADTLRRLAVTDADGVPRELVPLGPVRVAPPLPMAPVYIPPVAFPQPLAVADGLAVVGHDGLPAQAIPGLPVLLALGWEVSKPQTGRTVGVWLGDHRLGRLDLAALPLGRWRLAQALPVPFALASGTYPLLLHEEATAMATLLGHITVEPSSQPTHRLGARFADGITLEGWRAEKTDAGLLLTLFWQTDRPLDRDWTVFVHLVGAEGALVAQHDAAPDNGRYPTTLWPVGVLIPDRHLLPVSDLHPEMTLRVGLYLPGSGRRLLLATGDDVVAWPLIGP